MAHPFIVIADRGRLRMFSVEQVAAHLRLRPLADTQMVEPRLKTSEKYSDQAGSRDNPGDGMQFSGTDEQLTVGLEEDKRLFEHIGKSINALLHEHAVERWVFAAPAEVNAAILQHVEGKLKDRLEENVKRDLVNVDLENLARHFTIKLGTATEEARR
ncbi:MAG TPA: host attachment protein [Prosthecobacter sp.]|nr:host attachment protein [Prosthecobacter sp.]